MIIDCSQIVNFSDSVSPMKPDKLYSGLCVNEFIFTEQKYVLVRGIGLIRLRKGIIGDPL